MADSINSLPGGVDQVGAAERADGTAQTSGDRAATVIADFLNAARSAADSLLEEQKRQVAERISGVAEALRNAVSPLDRSQNGTVARLVEQGANRVGDFSLTLHNRRWNELVADTQDFAKRQPTLFVLGAVATGFLVGRLLWTTTDRQQRRGDSNSTGATTGAVTAAVSSGTGATDITSDTRLAPGSVEIDNATR
jgi:ElaB/YqjD/DUF883 family membrane-anchored ribosome-binding protein